MNARAIIAKLRMGKTLADEELAWFASGLASGAVTDAQAAAFAMAVCINGISEPERVAFTLAMRDSGETLAWDMDGPVVDKHSTGGVGDCVSLILAPALAACGVYVPMISGRGLGHTGGTLDKLEAIPGFDVDLSEARFREVVGDVGCAIVSASADLAPADKRLYAIRDVTATVESLDLITASILSKKLASGIGCLVLDVKVGSGAFMKSAEDAQALAASLVETAKHAGCPTAALITDMNGALIPSVGNAVEVAAIMRALGDEGAKDRLRLLTNALGGVLLRLAGVAASDRQGAATIDRVIADGTAREIFGRMVAAQGGPADFVENWQRHLPEAPVVRDVRCGQGGWVAAIDGEALGLAVVALGGGRMRGGDAIDHAVGLTDVVELGAKVDKGDRLARVHAADADAAGAAVQAIAGAITIGDTPPEAAALIKGTVV